MPPEIIVDDPPALVEALASRFESSAAAALSARGIFSAALPGGSVAATCFPRLAQTRLDWSRVELFWVDERAVAPDHPDSNYATARALWLEPAAVPMPRAHRMPAEVEDLEQAAALYGAELARVLGSVPILDLALLGVGADGHVASLFPAHPLLEEEGVPVGAVYDAPKPPPCRLTLTLPTLTAARLVVIVALGAAKANVVRQALQDENAALPVARVARRAEHVVFLLDAEAASLLAES